MKPLNGYGKAVAYSDNERLPAGGYVLKVLDVKYQENGWGDVILLSFDIHINSSPFKVITNFCIL